MTTVTPFLMFTGQAREAAELYVATIPGSAVESLELNPQDPTQVVKGVISVAGQRVRLYDSPPVHAFSFTPSFSFFVELDSSEQIDAVFTALAEGGATLMPLDAYPFSSRFGWCNDRFGVSWQISLRA